MRDNANSRFQRAMRGLPGSRSSHRFVSDGALSSRIRHEGEAERYHVVREHIDGHRGSRG